MNIPKEKLNKLHLLIDYLTFLAGRDLSDNNTREDAEALTAKIQELFTEMELKALKKLISMEDK